MAIRRGEATGEEETRTLARELGRRSVGQLEASLARTANEAGPIGRSIVGLLVLLNGGGIAVTAMSAGVMATQSVASAIILFVFGAALAVVGALVSGVAALVMGRHIGEASSHWAQVAASGEISDAALKAAGKVRRNGLIWATAPLAVALASLLLFMTGALTFADGLAQPAASVATAPVPSALPGNAAAPAANVASPVAAALAPAPQAGPSASAAQAQKPERRTPPRRVSSRPPTNPPAPAPTATP